MAFSDNGGSVSIARARRSRPVSVDDASRSGEIHNPITLDPYRHIVFPNAIRDVRMAKGHLKLLPFAARLGEMPYIRLSKIERGEVFARAGELVQIAAALDVSAADLLIDITSPAFDMARWAAPFAEGATLDDPVESRLAMLLAAAVRRARAADPQLTAAVVNDVYGIAPVILSRLENAHKGLSRWSPDIIAAIGRLLGDLDEPALRQWLETRYAAGDLDRFLAEIVGPEDRRQRTAQRIAALAIELDRPEGFVRRDAEPVAIAKGASRRVPLLGVPDSDGTIALTETGETFAIGYDAGPRAFAVRIPRATLGPGLPAGTTLVIDPDRHPSAGGLALVSEGARHRLVAVTTERTGALIGHSLYPEMEIAMDTLEPGAAAAVVAAVFN